MSIQRRLALLLAGCVLAFGVFPGGQADAQAPLPDGLQGIHDWTLAHPALRLWARADYPVASGRTRRGYYFGPRKLRPCWEDYQEAVFPNPENDRSRRVVYFDKARLEERYLSRAPDNRVVTAGLLATELITGQMQYGDEKFRTLPPADVPIAGDTLQPAEAPTYSSFREHLAPAQPRSGHVTTVLYRDGQTQDVPELGELYQVEYGAFNQELKHNIPAVFMEFFGRHGEIAEVAADGGVGFRQDQLVEWVEVMGFPLTEPFWGEVHVAGAPKAVLIQPFQRRVLTYTPENEPGFQVEMGNIGLHYLLWRHPNWQSQDDLVACTDRSDARFGDGGEQRTLAHPGGQVAAVAFGPDGGELVSGTLEGEVWLWPTAGDKSQGEPRLKMGGHEGQVLGVAFAPDGRTVASGSEDKTTRLWDARTGRLIRTLRSPSQGEGGILAVAFSPDGRMLATGGADSTVRLWRVSDGVELWNFSGLGHGNSDGHNQNVQSVAFSPDGRRIASGSLDGTVKLLNVAERRLERTIRGHADRVWGVAFSPDGRLVASTSSDRTARLWRVDDGGLERILLGHEEEVRCAIAFNRDGSLVAAASNFEVVNDPTRRMEVRIWRVATGDVAAVVDAHRNTVRSVAFSPRDPAQFATASYDRTVRLWDLTGI